MSKLSRVLPSSALLAGLALPLSLGGGPALAQTAPALTAAQSASLDRAIRLWTNSPAPEKPGAPADFTVRPEGDHYRLDKPLAMPATQSGPAMQGGALTAEVRPLDGGRWQFSDVRLGTPFIVTAPTGKDAGVARVTVDLKGQSGLVVVDPSLSTPSTFDGAAAGISGGMDVPLPASARNPVPTEISASFRGGAFKRHGVWQPAGPGRVDRSSATTLDDLALDIAAAKQKVSVAIHALRGDVTANGLSLDRLAAVTALMRDKVPGITRAKPPEAAGSPAARPPLTAEQRQALHALLSDIRDLASSLDANATLEDIAFSNGDHVVQLRRITMAGGVAAPGGRADAHMRLVVEGLASPDIPPAIAQSYLPRRLVIAPRVSGLDADALFDMIATMIDGVAPSPRDAQARAAALLAHGPVSVGLDELAFDIGPTQVSATGAVQVASPALKELTGSATIEAKHLNALLARSNTDPLLHQAAPVLIFLKGIGEEDDSGNVVWKVAYGGGKVMVNGADLSQMLTHK